MVELTVLEDNDSEGLDEGSTEDGYFAAIADAKKFANEAYSRVEHFENTRQYILYRWHRNYLFYHNLYYQEGQSHSGGYSDIRYTGENGEYATMSVNHFRNLATHLKNLMTSSRVTFQCRAINGDAKSSSQAELGNTLLDYYMREGRLSEVANDAVDNCLIFDAGYIKVEWDPEAGRELGVDTDAAKIYNEGDLTFTSINPIDVITDVHKLRYRDNDWIILRTQQSKWNLIARFPEHKEAIEGMSTLDDEWRRDFNYYSDFTKSDDIFLYEFWHKKTPAMPNGRYTLFTSDGNVFYDAPLQYREIPIYQITAGPHKAVQFGYSPMNDVAGAQEAVNMCYSIMLTNLETFGVQNVVVPRESGVTIEEVRSGLNFIEYDAQYGPPKGINFTQIPSELMAFMAKLEQAQETLAGVNSVVRGNPEASLRSGTALALVQNMSLQFASYLQAEYVRLLEDVGRQSIDILKVYANTKRVFTIVGEGSLAALKEFRGEDLENISRVVVDLGSALSRTAAGRVQMAGDLIKSGLLKTPEEYITVVETGNMDQLVRGRRNHLRLIHRENEDLMRGVGAQAILTDDHSLHIRKHTEILDDPAVRADPQMTQPVLSHIQEHMQLMMEPDLQLFYATMGMQSPGLMAQQQQAGPQSITPEQGAAMDRTAETEQEVAQALRNRPDIQEAKLPENFDSGVPPM